MPKSLMKIRKIIDIEVEGVGAKIEKARRDIAGYKSLAAICREVGVTTSYWYSLEQERNQGALSEENLRKIEAVLDIDFGISFEGA